MNDELDLIPLVNYASSSQQWILQPMHSMKERDDKPTLYGNTMTGTCYGYAAMVMLALLQEDRNDDGHLKGLVWFTQLIKRFGVIVPGAFSEHMALLYRKRLAIIEQVIAENPLLNGLERQACIHQALQQHLTDDELLDLDLPVLFDGMELFQQSHQYNELHQGRIKSQVMEPLLPLLAFDCHETLGGIAFVKDFLGVFTKKKAKNKDELCLYLSLLRQAMVDLTYPIAMQLISNGHAIAVAYDSQKNYWVCSDVNRGVNNVIITHEDSELAWLIQDSFYKSFIHQLDELPIVKDSYQKQYLLIKERLYYVDDHNHCHKIIPHKGKEEYVSSKIADIQTLMGDNKRLALSFDTIDAIKSHCHAYGDSSFIVNTSFYVTKIHHDSLLSCLNRLERRPKFQSIMALTDEKCDEKNAFGKKITQLKRPHDIDNAQFKLGKMNLIADVEHHLQRLKRKTNRFFMMAKESKALQIHFWEEVLSHYLSINTGNTHQPVRDANLQKAMIHCYARFSVEGKPVAAMVADHRSKTALLIQATLPTKTELNCIDRIVNRHKKTCQQLQKHLHRQKQDCLDNDDIDRLLNDIVRLLSCADLSINTDAVLENTFHETMLLLNDRGTKLS